MRTVAATRQDLASPDFADAELSVKIAAAEFADTAALEGRSVALKQFNHRVSFWANRFTNVRYRRYVYTVASCMDGETHTFRVTQAALRAKYRKQHPGKKVPCHSTIQNYNEAMAAAGIFDVIHHRQGSEDENPGAYETTEYHVHFGRVLVIDQVVPHDFTQVSPGARQAESDTSHSRTKTSNGSGDGFTDGSGDGFADIRLLSTSSPTSSPTASSTRPGDDEAAAAAYIEDQDGEATRDEGDGPDYQDSLDGFFSWIGKTLGVPQSFINRPVILARMDEVEQDFPGLDWSVLKEYADWDSYRRHPRPRRLGILYNHLAEIVQAVFDARLDEELEALQAVHEEEERQREEEARQARLEAQEAARKADEARTAELKQEMHDLLDEYMATFRPGTYRGTLEYQRDQAIGEIDRRCPNAYNAGLHLNSMKLKIERYQRAQLYEQSQADEQSRADADWLARTTTE